MRLYTGSRARFANLGLRYGLALAAVLTAAAVRWALQPVMGVAPPYITFYLAIVVAAAFGGFGPGVFATFLGALLGVGLATVPIDKLQLGTAAEQVRLIIYALSGLGISLIAAGMHDARRRAHEEAEHLRRTTEQLRRANEQLVEADRSKDRFLAVLSHELRNPLMPIKNSLYVLREADAEGETARRARETIERQVNQIVRLVNDLMDVTRITRDKLKLQRSRFDLRHLVSRTLEDHRALFVARGIELHDQEPNRPVWVHADWTRLSQALANLLHNALKFSCDGGQVHVKLEQHEGHAFVTVRDNGVGISRELLPHVFEPFVQAEQKLDRRSGGLGLGLTLVKKLLELHGGSVQARSEGPEKGAEFEMALPVAARPPTEAAADAIPASAAARRVLLIEDNADSADTLRLLLEMKGHAVEVCYSGAEGLEKAGSVDPDIVLCDIGLPGMDGYQVVRALRRDPALAHATLVALTGYASPEDRNRALAAGFDKHLVKPPDPEELERVLNDARRA